MKNTNKLKQKYWKLFIDGTWFTLVTNVIK